VRTPEQTPELLPCPFCGGEPSTVERPDNIDGTEFFYAVACYCGGYSACAHKMAKRKTPEQAKADAIAAWNRRSARSAEPVKPVAWTVAGKDEGREVLLPTFYLDATAGGVEAQVARSAIKEGFVGTVEQRLAELGWRIVPLYSSPPSPAEPVKPPEGWKLVPVEPTREMEMAALEASRANGNVEGTSGPALPVGYELWCSRLVYRVMLAAAPRAALNAAHGLASPKRPVLMLDVAVKKYERLERVRIEFDDARRDDVFRSMGDAGWRPAGSSGPANLDCTRQYATYERPLASLPGEGGEAEEKA
jgi:Lar family restriction alleviation protein